MKGTQANKAVFLTFAQGILFWTASTTMTGFFPLLAISLQLSAYEAGIFLAGAAIGRAIFQPLAGLIITPNNAGRYYLAGLGCSITSSLLLVYSEHASCIILARVIEGIGLSLFVVAWRTLLNRMMSMHCFDSVNESYVLSQNIGRMIGPAIGGLLVAHCGIPSVFIFPAMQYALCLLISNQYRIQPDINLSLPEHYSSNISARMKIYRHQASLLFVHHIEFFCLGLWLASWPIYAIAVNKLTAVQLGYSFTAAAIGGLGLFIIKPLISMLSMNNKFAISLVLLVIQPIAALLIPHWSLLLGLSCAIGGLGSAIYFTNFHRLLSNCYPVEKIPLIYGMLGSTTFLCQAAGQAITPILKQKLSITMPILLDVGLLLSCLIYILLSKRETNKYR